MHGPCLSHLRLLIPQPFSHRLRDRPYRPLPLALLTSAVAVVKLGEMTMQPGNHGLRRVGVCALLFITCLPYEGLADINISPVRDGGNGVSDTATLAITKAAAQSQSTKL